MVTFEPQLSTTNFCAEANGINLSVLPALAQPNLYRFADGQYNRLPVLVAELVSRRVTIIVGAGGGRPALAAKAATSTIPIVFVSGDTDPVEAGLVTSLSRPAGNLTGVASLLGTLMAKRVGLLHELIPKAGTMAVLAKPI